MSNVCEHGADRVSTASSQLPGFSISQVTTLTAGFFDDLQVYHEEGVDGIGVWELKLGDGPDDEAIEALRTSGLRAASAVPSVPSILPLPLLPGPDDPRERIDSLLASLHRLAPFVPSAVLCFTGPGDDRATVIDGLKELGAEAGRLGLTLALEPFQREAQRAGRRSTRSARLPSCSTKSVRRRSESSSTRGISGTRRTSTTRSSTTRTASSACT